MLNDRLLTKEEKEDLIQFPTPTTMQYKLTTASSQHASCSTATNNALI